jgi:hypothetical protein
MLNEMERVSWKTALYNLDQPILLGMGALPSEEMDPANFASKEQAYQQGLRRGAIEVIARLLGYPENLNQVWGGAPLTIERGKYGRYDERSSL